MAHLECLTYAYDYGKDQTCTQAAFNDHLDCLKYAYNSYPIDVDFCIKLTKNK